MPAPELRRQWQTLFDTPPPRYNRRFLESRLAYRLQELAYGGLKPETVRRLEQLGEQLDGGNIAVRRRRADERPIAGTSSSANTRASATVTVLQDGYEWQGRPYKSLSAIARAITGTRWNGLVFFGLKNRRDARMSKRRPEASLRHLHPQVQRGRAGAGVQLASTPSATPAAPTSPASGRGLGRSWPTGTTMAASQAAPSTALP